MKSVYIKVVISYILLFDTFPEKKNLTPWVTQFLCHDTEVPTAFLFHQKWRNPLFLQDSHC